MRLMDLNRRVHANDLSTYTHYALPTGDHVESINPEAKELETFLYECQISRRQFAEGVRENRLLLWVLG